MLYLLADIYDILILSPYDFYEEVRVGLIISILQKENKGTD